MVALVHGGPFSDYAEWVFEDQKLIITLFETDENSVFQPTGALTIDKTGDNKTIEAVGTLKFHNVPGVLMHYAFDETVDAYYPNTGRITPKQYRAYGVNITPATGRLAGAVEFSADNYSFVSYGEREPDSEYLNEGMILADSPRSISAWVKTTADGWNTVFKAGLISLRMEDGRLALAVGAGKARAASVAPLVNDGAWHHIVATYPGNQAPIESATLYIDGEVVEKESAATATLDWFDADSWFSSGNHWTVNADSYTGVLDDLGFWFGALESPMVKAMYNAIEHSDLAYNAGEMDQLFQVYRSRGTATVAGTEWGWAQCSLTTPGSVTKNGSYYSIVLDNQGYCVTSDPVLL